MGDLVSVIDRKVVIYLSVIVGFLFISSFFISDTFALQINPDILSGFIDSELMLKKNYISVLSSALFITLISLSLYHIGDRCFQIGNNSFVTILFYLLITYSNANTIFFSDIFPAILALIWSLYYSILYRMDGLKREMLFRSIFLFMVAILFYIKFIYLLPLFIVLNLYKSIDFRRAILVTILALFIPLFILFSVRYILFGDTFEYIEGFINLLKDNKIYNFPTLKVSALFLILIVCYLSVKSGWFALFRLAKYKTIKARSFIRLSSFLLILSISTLLFYSNKGGETGLLAAPFIAIFLSNYFLLSTNKKLLRVEMIIFILAIVLNRVSLLIL